MNNTRDVGSVKVMPVWVAILVSLLGMALTAAVSVASDRVQLAANMSQLEVRIKLLEESRAESRMMDAEILKALHTLGEKVADNALLLQEVRDKQQEVRRALKIHE